MIRCHKVILSALLPISDRTVIRTSGAYDGVFDFDAAVRDPARPTTVLGTYDAGDRLHLNAAGYEAMARAIDLTVFRR